MFLPASIEAKDAHCRRVLDADRLRRDRDVRPAIAVRVDQLAVIHPVQVIAGENQVVVGVVAREVAHRLPHGIRRALIPIRIVRCLFGREDLDEALAEQVHAVRLRDMAVERGGVELREYKNATDVSMQTVADRNVNQPILPADRHGRLRSMVCERKEASALTAPEDERQHVVVHGDRGTQRVHPLA